MIANLDRVTATKKSGHERFTDGAVELAFDLLSFWRWSASDLLSNATRGILAEYLVAHALGVDAESVRDEWAPYDLITPDGVKVEVKSAAFLQSWYQGRPSRVSFVVPKTRAWDASTNRLSEELARQADVYVFALLAHQDKATINPMDISGPNRFHPFPEGSRFQESSPTSKSAKRSTPALLLARWSMEVGSPARRRALLTAAMALRMPIRQN